MYHRICHVWLQPHRRIVINKYFDYLRVNPKKNKVLCNRGCFKKDFFIIQLPIKPIILDRKYV